jgi:hypothetical protein
VREWMTEQVPGGRTGSATVLQRFGCSMVCSPRTPPRDARSSRSPRSRPAPTGSAARSASSHGCPPALPAPPAGRTCSPGSSRSTSSPARTATSPCSSAAWSSTPRPQPGPCVASAHLAPLLAPAPDRRPRRLMRGSAGRAPPGRHTWYERTCTIRATRQPRTPPPRHPPVRRPAGQALPGTPSCRLSPHGDLTSIAQSGT